MTAVAELMAGHADTTVITTALTSAQLDDARLDTRVRYVAVPRPTGPGHCLSESHHHAVALFEAYAATYPGGGCDLVISGDYRGEAAVLLQARRTGHPALAGTTVVLRTAGTYHLLATHDGGVLDSLDVDVQFDLEQLALREADHLWTQCQATADAYARFYGRENLAPATVLPTPELHLEVQRWHAPGDGPLRLLALGRLQRWKGTLDLVDGFRRVADDGWRLTIVGRDTSTATGAGSVREAVEQACLADDRITVCDPVPRSELPALFAEHDVFVAASRFETWGHSPCEALLSGLPLLVTPVGGFPEMCDRGRLGWICDGVGPDALARGLRRLLADRDRVLRIRASGEPRAHVLRLADGAALRDGLLELAATPSPRFPPAHTAPRPLVTVVVPYWRTAATVCDTLASLSAQTHRPIELLVVNDGSFDAADAGLWDLAAEHGARVLSCPNRGPAAARNLGVRHASGDLVAFLDADDIAHPTWLERAIRVLAAEPELGYVATWMRHVDADGRPTGGSWRPLGNDVSVNAQLNVAGGSAVVVPRRRFTEEGLWFDEQQLLRHDWELWRRMERAGRHGRVIAEELIDHRDRPGRSSRHVTANDHARALAEINSGLRAREVQWTTN